MDAANLLNTCPRVDPVVAHAAAAAVAVVLITGSLQKLRDLALFRDAVSSYRLLAPFWVAFVARALPIGECIAGIAIVTEPLHLLGALLALAVLATATGAVAVNVWRGRTRIDCGCGGDLHLPLSLGLVIRNSALMAAATLPLLPTTGRPTTWLDLSTAAFLLLGALALYALTNALLRNQARLSDLRNAP